MGESESNPNSTADAANETLEGSVSSEVDGEGGRSNRSIDAEKMDAAFADVNSAAVGSDDDSDGDEKPDPSELKRFDASEHIYQRDEKGDLILVDDAIRVDGDWQRIERLPTTKGFLNRVRQKFEGREEVDLDELDALMEDFYPEIGVSGQEWDDMDSKLYMPLLTNMISVVRGNVEDETTQEIQQAVEERQTEGN